MQIIQAECGEMIYTFLKRVVDTACTESTVFKARHNTTEVIVYPDSSMSDICDKFDMQTKINRLQQGA